jgi:hypothetical protein
MKLLLVLALLVPLLTIGSAMHPRVHGLGVALFGGFTFYAWACLGYLLSHGVKL